MNYLVAIGSALFLSCRYRTSETSVGASQGRDVLTFAGLAIRAGAGEVGRVALFLGGVQDVDESGGWCWLERGGRVLGHDG